MPLGGSPGKIFSNLQVRPDPRGHAAAGSTSKEDPIITNPQAWEKNSLRELPWVPLFLLSVPDMGRVMATERAGFPAQEDGRASVFPTIQSTFLLCIQDIRSEGDLARARQWGWVPPIKLLTLPTLYVPGWATHPYLSQPVLPV